MALKEYNPVTPARRYLTTSDYTDVTRSRPERSLVVKKKGSGGRNHFGRQTNINIGGGHKQRYRLIDFRRDKDGIPATVVSIEYDPCRTARIALVQYRDGEKRYILAPNGLTVGQTVESGPNSEVKTGNCLPLKNVPTGVPIHNLELKVGGGAQLVRSAGNSAQLVAKESEYGLVRLPSGEMRRILIDCRATIGVVSNSDHANITIGKAGRSRWLGIRPHNRGTSKNPVDHPMGGGQGKTAGGRQPCSPLGLQAKGLRTRANKRTDRFIVRRRFANSAVSE